MLHKINELRKPKTNVQMLQNTGLLKYHHLMQFLMEKAPDVAEEVRATYMDSMSRTLHSIFKVLSRLRMPSPFAQEQNQLNSRRHEPCARPRRHTTRS
jgi:hypothetical protein